jgi:preprotein translocase subunit SecG
VCTLLLSYFGNARTATSSSVLETANPALPAAVPAAQPVASGAAQIPTK